MVHGKDCRIWHPELSVLLECTIGDRCTIHAPVWIGNNVVIGNDCKVQAFSFIPEGVMISDWVFIGPRVTFTNDKYPPSKNWATTHVGPYASIGAGSVIVAGVSIGAHALIGAGSVVTKDVPVGGLVYGNPAKLVRYRAVA